MRDAIQNLHHWRYFISIEEDLIRLSRYVELSEDNFKTYSIELTRLLFAASSEANIIAKLLFESLGGKRGEMKSYLSKIREKWPQINCMNIKLDKSDLSFVPWAEKDLPAWWDAYNGVKHMRHEEYQKANLKNVLNAISGLFALLLFFYSKGTKTIYLFPIPKFITPDSIFDEKSQFWGTRKSVIYEFINKATRQGGHEYIIL